MLLQERPYESSEHYEPAETGEFRSFVPSETGEYQIVDHSLAPTSDDLLLLQSLDRHGRIVSYLAGGVASLALLAIAIVLVPFGGGGDSVVLAQELQLNSLLTTTSAAPTTTAPRPVRPDFGEPSAVLVGFSQMVEEVEAMTTTTEATGWVEPEIEPESQWKDSGNGVMLPDLLLRIRFCESTNNYLASHTNSSARGAYQFLVGSWEWYGHAERYGVSTADQATPAQQDEAALLTYQKDGARPWAESRPCWSNPNIDSRYLTARPRATTTTAPPSTTTTTGGETTTTTTGETTTTSGETTTTTTTTTTSSTTPPSSETTTSTTSS
ncbi:MAG: transglycosylase family protein [Actinomycetota bacterium]